MLGKYPSLVRFLRQQSLYLAISAVCAAIFWANGQQINPGTVILYSLLFGNILTPIGARLHVVYSSKPFPWNWLLFIAVTLLLMPPVFIVTSAVVWWIAPPSPQTFLHLITTGWKFPCLVVVVFSTVLFLYSTTRERLERRNLELKKAIDRGTAQLEMQELELHRAREIQQSLLPKEIPQLAGFEVAGAWQPALSVSGDYYDVRRLSDRRLGICIADVAGKGVSASLLMANIQAAVRAFASDSESPADLCAKVNRLLCENLATGKFVTFLYGVLDGDARTFQFCNAGHLYPILASATSVRALEPGGAVLGVFPTWTYDNLTVELQPGDRLLLFTDGITEATDAKGVEFEEARIASFAKANSTLSAKELNSRLLAQVASFCSDRFHDDATLLVIAAN
jgi:sigma-B regulation protein RsbU (phosphoserine phosphatase)